MLRECVRFLKENENTWKKDEDARTTERQKKEQKNKLRQAELRKTAEQKEKETQRKITETWKMLPEHEQRSLAKEEEKGRKLELREVKLNIWKKWRAEP